MIHIQQEIINGLLIETPGSNVKAEMGRDVFWFVYERGQDMISVGCEKKRCTLKEALRIDDNVKKSIPNMKNLWFLDHYFRHLYRILKFIDEADEKFVDLDKKYEYACIVRATLSQYELIMLFYNGFSHPKFKALMEKYAILNNLRIELLASTDDTRLYGKKIGQAYSCDEDKGKNMEMEYAKLAFVHS